MPKINWSAIGKRLFNWGKKKAAEELEAEVERRVQERLGSKTTNDSDISSSSMTRPEP